MQQPDVEKSEDVRGRLATAYVRLTTPTSGAPSVAAVAQAAGVNRSTFYAHFPSITALTLSVLDSTLTSIFQLEIDSLDSRPLTTGEVRDRTSTAIVSAVQRNRAALAAAVANDRARSRQMIGAAILRNNRVIISRFPGWSEMEPNRLTMLTTYLAHGWAGALCAWLAGEIALEPDALLNELMVVNPDGQAFTNASG